ncbi:MAG TPA: hypothetical protein ENH10_04235 [Bacteroidetes bacterium]|nr:hypothetical protein [Bacteroidota bacterium]HEX04353.1 hypothetical protein [Bacteroidota bacterium]
MKPSDETHQLPQELEIYRLADMVRTYQAKHPHDVSSEPPQLDNAIKSGLGAAVLLSRTEPERALRGLDSVWSTFEDSPDHSIRDAYLFYELEKELAEQAFAKRAVDVAAWLLANSLQ